MSAYLLAQLNASEALPDMLAAYRVGRRLPTDKQFAFYSMHLLMLHHPAEGLSQDALTALAAYREAAASVPSVDVEKGAAWNSPFDEHDFRTRMTGEGPLVEDEWLVDVTFYPAVFEERSYGKVGPLTPKFDLSLVGKIDHFVRLAYPGFAAAQADARDRE